MVLPSLNKEDPCYIGIQRIRALLRNAESEGWIHRTDLRLDTFFTPSGAVSFYRVNFRTKAGWQTRTFSQEDMSKASDEAYFQQHLAEQVKQVLPGPDSDQA